MANFQYIARTAAGEQVSGMLQADSSSAVVRVLDDKNLFPVQISEQAAFAGPLGPRRIPMRQVGIMYGQLADLLRAGVPLMRALDTLHRASVNPRLKDLVGQTREAVSQGDTLADALGHNPATFPPLHLAMVRAGERGGFIEDVLTNLAGFIERQDELTGKVRGALIYPLILVVFGTAVLLGLLIGVVPQFKPMFKGMPLPLPTQVLFAASGLIIDHWPLTLGLLMVAGAMLAFLFRGERGKRLWDAARFRIPFFGPAMRLTSITRFCRILGTMLANGVPLLQALAISKDATGSLVLSRIIEEAAESVRAGQTLSRPLGQGGMFPAEVLEMMAVAEESNQLEKVLVQIADTVERRTTRRIDSAVRLIEPMVLLVIASAIAFMALGLLYPIFTMSQTLKR